MRPPPGSFALLARNEWRLYLRSGLMSRTSLVFLIITQVLLYLFAVTLVSALSVAQRAGAPPVAGNAALLPAVGLLAMLLLMTSRALAGAVQSLYTRGDLDLLLSSPVDRRSIIGVRLGSLAVTVTLEVALLVFPFANVFVLFGHFAWIRAYLLVPAMAMLATSIGIWLTLLAFRTIGPRRTRVVVQVFAVLVGTAMMLAFYLPQLLHLGNRSSNNGFAMLAQSGGGFRYMLASPAQWLLQGYLPILELLAGATALIVGTVLLAGEPLVGALTGIAGSSAPRARRGAGTAAVRFRDSFRTVVVLKELKLIARDPFLVAQILQQSLYVLPMAFVLWRTHTPGGMPLPWLAIIWLAAALAGPLSWLTILAEDAPDLLASAPVTRAVLIRAKIEAAVLPTLPICALPLFVLLPSHPWFAVCVTACAFGAALSNALINTGNPVAQRRDSFKARRRSSGGSGLLELISMAFWLLLCLGLGWGGKLLLGWS